MNDDFFFVVITLRRSSTFLVGLLIATAVGCAEKRSDIRSDIIEREGELRGGAYAYLIRKETHSDWMNCLVAPNRKLDDLTFNGHVNHWQSVDGRDGNTFVIFADKTWKYSLSLPSPAEPWDEGRGFYTGRAMGTYDELSGRMMGGSSYTFSGYCATDLAWASKGAIACNDRIIENARALAHEAILRHPELNALPKLHEAILEEPPVRQTH